MSSIPCGETFFVLPNGPPIVTMAASCFSTQPFQAAMPSRAFFCRSASGRAFQATIFGLVLLPRKTARKVLFVVMMLILSGCCSEQEFNLATQVIDTASGNAGVAFRLSQNKCALQHRLRVQG